MEIDSLMNDIWRVIDGIRTVAICYSKKEAEVCKAALEKYKAGKEQKEHEIWQYGFE